MENRMDSKLDVLNYKQMDGLRVFLNTLDYRTPHFHKELEILLILDGDGIDRRNSHDGQIKTRLEAFLEMIQQEEESAAC